MTGGTQAGVPIPQEGVVGDIRIAEPNADRIGEARLAQTDEATGNQEKGVAHRTSAVRKLNL